VSDAVTESSVALRTRARIGAHVIWDHLAKPMAVAAQDVPWGVSAMTSQWLTAVLGRGVPGCGAVDVDADAVSPTDDARNATTRNVSRDDPSYDDRDPRPRRTRPGASIMSENIVPIGDWGKHPLEELLFRAAERVGTDTSRADCIEVTLTFRIRPDLVAGCLEISVPGLVESALITRLPRPF
jgi:hypothetical protein